MSAAARFVRLFAFPAWLALSASTLSAQSSSSGATQGSEDRLRAAETALEHNDLKTAANLLSQLAQERPQDAHVLYDLGYADEGLGETKAAMAAYKRALAVDPANAEAHVALGLLLAREGTGSEIDATAQLRSGADNSTAPSEVRAHALRALASLEESDQPAKASEDLLQAVRLTHETEPDVVESADLALAVGDLADADKAYRRALELAPDDVTASTGLAQVLQQNKQLPQADEVLSAALKSHPADPRVRSALAAIKADEKEPAQAVALLEPMVSAASAVQNPALARELAQLYSMTSQMEKAGALYGELAAAQPNDPLLLDDYGDVLVRVGKFSQAEAMLQRAVANRAAWSKPTDWAEAAGHLAFAASRNHDPQVTLQALAARATVLPNSPATLFLEATAHDSLKQNGDARRAYRAFLAVANGQFPDEEFEARHRLVALENVK